MTQQSAKRIRYDRIALVLAGVLALGAIGYGVMRANDKPAPQPVAAAPGASLTLADLEKATVDNPEDAVAWQRLAQAYADAVRWTDAASAYDRAARLAPGDASVWSALGEARVMASERDPMPPQAAAAFAKALSIDPKDPRARYFTAVKRDLGGDHAGAVADWLALLADTPADAPWRSDLVRTIEQVAKINKLDVANKLASAQTAGKALTPAASLPTALQGIPGPTAQDLARASAMRPNDQRAMAEGMVERLEGRLKTDPANIDGWIMLIRSRVTLEQPEKAAAALKAAVAANPGKAEFLRQQAGVLGVR
jgi:cytochrome c-type biogenesis protein CcmH